VPVPGTNAAPTKPGPRPGSAAGGRPGPRRWVSTPSRCRAAANSWTSAHSASPAARTTRPSRTSSTGLPILPLPGQELEALLRVRQRLPRNPRGGPPPSPRWRRRPPSRVRAARGSPAGCRGQPVVRGGAADDASADDHRIRVSIGSALQRPWDESSYGGASRALSNVERSGPWAPGAVRWIARAKEGDRAGPIVIPDDSRLCFPDAGLERIGPPERRSCTPLSRSPRMI